jgi:hypothetical protein
MVDANNLSKYNDLWLGAMLLLGHGHHRRQRPSKELPLCYVLVEFQLTTFHLSFGVVHQINPLRIFLGDLSAFRVIILSPYFSLSNKIFFVAPLVYYGILTL